ncbi:MAG: 50S ribosomal protein L17 [Treponema sp.]|jgi:large subunit ribosomal protein L17|nr:50S ribosomal protein L17 [Treponema sp.]
MNHRSGFNPLERMAASRKALHRSMVTSLFRYERIRTTKAKALAIRRSAEKLITRAKVDSVHNRRIVSARLYDEGIVAKLFTDIALRMKERPGGYTRILKLGERLGDAAEIVILELVDYKLDIDGPTGKKAKKVEKTRADADSGKKKTGGKKTEKGSAKAAAAKGKTTTTRKTAPAAN